MLNKTCATVLLVLALSPFTAPFQTCNFFGEKTLTHEVAAVATSSNCSLGSDPGSLLAPLTVRGQLIVPLTYRAEIVPIAEVIIGLPVHVAPPGAGKTRSAILQV